MLRLFSKLMRYVAIAIGTIITVLVLAWLGARYADGPIAVFPGGPFTSGVLTEYASVDWPAIAGLRELEFQLEAPPRSRTARFILHDEQLYIPCAFCSNHFLKRWPRELERDDRIIVRIAGMRIPARAVRVPDRSPEFLAVRAASQTKYRGSSGARAAFERKAAGAVVGAARLAPGAARDEPDDWLFRVEPR